MEPTALGLLLAHAIGVDISQKAISNTKNTRNPDLGPISIFGFLQYFHQNLVNGLDLNRFCVPEHIIQMSNSKIC